MRARPHPTRRAVLTTLGTVALAGATAACELPGPGSPRGVDNGGNEPPDPDRRRLGTARAQAEELLALVVSTSSAHAALTSRLAPLADCHRAHLRALDGEAAAASPEPTSPPAPTASAPTAPSPTPPPAPEVALRRLVAREEAHASALRTEAGVAESGALARLLATMAAGVLMHLDALENAPSGGDR